MSTRGHSSFWGLPRVFNPADVLLVSVSSSLTLSLQPVRLAANSDFLFTNTPLVWSHLPVSHDFKNFTEWRFQNPKLQFQPCGSRRSRGSMDMCWMFFGSELTCVIKNNGKINKQDLRRLAPSTVIIPPMTWLQHQSHLINPHMQRLPLRMRWSKHPP